MLYIHTVIVIAKTRSVKKQDLMIKTGKIQTF